MESHHIKVYPNNKTTTISIIWKRAMDKKDKRYLTEKEVAAITGLSLSMIQKMRGHC